MKPRKTTILRLKMKRCVSAGVKQETKRQTTTHGNPNRQRHFSYLEFLRNVSNVILRQILKMFGLDNGKQNNSARP